MKTDIICITGLPRAGTTFLLRCFHTFRLGRILNKNGGYFVGEWNESKMFEECFTDKRLNPFPIFDSYINKYKKTEKDIIIYKHPQAILVDVIPKKYNVKYIFCIRGYNGWKKSIDKHGSFENTLKIDSEYSWVKDNWVIDFNHPKSMQNRFLHFYNIVNLKIEERHKKENSIFFDFNNPFESFINFIRFIEIKEDHKKRALKAFKLLWSTEFN